MDQTIYNKNPAYQLTGDEEKALSLLEEVEEQAFEEQELPFSFQQWQKTARFRGNRGGRRRRRGRGGRIAANNRIHQSHLQSQEDEQYKNSTDMGLNQRQPLQPNEIHTFVNNDLKNIEEKKQSVINNCYKDREIIRQTLMNAQKSILLNLQNVDDLLWKKVQNQKEAISNLEKDISDPMANIIHIKNPVSSLLEFQDNTAGVVLTAALKSRSIDEDPNAILKNLQSNSQKVVQDLNNFSEKNIFSKSNEEKNQKIQAIEDLVTKFNRDLVKIINLDEQVEQDHKEFKHLAQKNSHSNTIFNKEKQSKSLLLKVSAATSSKVVQDNKKQPVKKFKYFTRYGLSYGGYNNITLKLLRNVKVCYLFNITQFYSRPCHARRNLSSCIKTLRQQQFTQISRDFNYYPRNQFSIFLSKQNSLKPIIPQCNTIDIEISGEAWKFNINKNHKVKNIHINCYRGEHDSECIAQLLNQIKTLPQLDNIKVSSDDYSYKFQNISSYKSNFKTMQFGYFLNNLMEFQFITFIDIRTNINKRLTNRLYLLQKFQNLYHLSISQGPQSVVLEQILENLRLPSKLKVLMFSMALAKGKFDKVKFTKFQDHLRSLNCLETFSLSKSGYSTKDNINFAYIAFKLLQNLPKNIKCIKHEFGSTNFLKDQNYMGDSKNKTKLLNLEELFVSGDQNGQIYPIKFPNILRLIIKGPLERSLSSQIRYFTTPFLEKLEISQIKFSNSKTLLDLLLSLRQYKAIKYFYIEATGPIVLDPTEILISLINQWQNLQYFEFAVKLLQEQPLNHLGTYLPELSYRKVKSILEQKLGPNNYRFWIDNQYSPYDFGSWGLIQEFQNIRESFKNSYLDVLCGDYKKQEELTRKYQSSQFQY